MEPIKISENVEFDVIYADGTRHRVKEGILFEVDGRDMVSHNGTDRLSVLFAVAESALELIDFIGETKRFAKGLWKASPECLGRKALMKILVAFYPLTSQEKQAVFRLGQKDMQASVCDMPRQLADGATDPVSAGLILAADLVEGMEVDHANS